MYVKSYEFELEKEDGSSVEVALRLTISGQMKLKKKWKEATTDTLFGAVDDIERFVDVMDTALTYPGNKNEITKGEELIDLMASNELLGMEAKQQLITSLGKTSGVFSSEEKEAIDRRAGQMIKKALAGEEIEADTESKNA